MLKRDTTIEEAAVAIPTDRIILSGIPEIISEVWIPTLPGRYTDNTKTAMPMAGARTLTVMNSLAPHAWSVPLTTGNSQIRSSAPEMTVARNMYITVVMSA